jgi:hypothetical protein
MAVQPRAFGRTKTTCLRPSTLLLGREPPKRRLPRRGASVTPLGAHLAEHFARAGPELAHLGVNFRAAVANRA